MDLDVVEAAATICNLYMAYSSVRHATSGRDVLQMTLTIQKREYGPKHYSLAAVLGSLGYTFGDLGHVAQQWEFLQRALAIHEGRRHVGTSTRSGIILRIYQSCLEVRVVIVRGFPLKLSAAIMGPF